MKKERTRLDYKWVIVALCFLMVFTALGFCSSTKSQFIEPVTGALGINRTPFSFIDSFRYIASTVVNIFFGALVNRFGAKKLIGAGFASLISAMLIHAFAGHIALFYLGGVLLGVGFSWTTTTMVGYVVNKWCRRNKGKIMGAALAANGLGGALALQIVTPIIESSADGYKKAYLLISAVLLAVAVLVVAFFKNEPKNSVEADAAPVKSKKRGESWVGIELSVAKKRLFFYGACVSIFLAGFTLQGITGVAGAHMRDVGLDPAYVATVLSVHSMVLAVSKFLTGFIYDKFGLRISSSICSVIAVAVMLLLSALTSSPLGAVLAMLYGIFSSFALPIETIMLPLYAGDLFGQKSYNKILGIFVSVNTAGYAVGAPFMNLCFDLTGSYKIAMIIAATLMALSFVIMQLVISTAHKVRRSVEEEEAVNSEEVIVNSEEGKVKR